MWGSSGGGYRWEQFRDPAFVGLPANSDANYFDLDATRGSHWIFGPGIGGTLAFGEGGSGQADLLAQSTEVSPQPTSQSASQPNVYPAGQ